MKSSSCNQCGKTYASSQSLWNHKQRCKKSATSQYQDLVSNHKESQQAKNPVVSKKVSDFINYQQRHNSIQTTNNSTSKEDIGKEADISTKEWSNGTIEFRYNQTCAAPQDS